MFIGRETKIKQNKVVVGYIIYSLIKEVLIISCHRKMEKNKELEWAKAQKIEIGVDLVAAAKRQLQFLSAVDSDQFLHEGPILDRAIYR